MSDKTWKAKERKIAKFFGTERTPLSGGNSKQTRSDTLHHNLFIEQKHRKKHSVVGLWDDTKTLADKESKIPVITLTQANRKGFWVLVHCDDLVEVAGEVEQHITLPRKLIEGEL